MFHHVSLIFLSCFYHFHDFDHVSSCFCCSSIIFHVFHHVSSCFIVFIIFHDFGRQLVLPAQRLTCAGDPLHLLQGGGVGSGCGRVGADVVCHGWQVAFDGSWGLSPTSGERVLSWGLILWNESEPPCMWAVMGGCVELSASGENGSDRAELEALCTRSLPLDAELSWGTAGSLSGAEGIAGGAPTHSC